MENIESLKISNCECGRQHDISVKNIIIEENALEKVPRLLASLTAKRKVYIIGDQNTFKAAGNKLTEILKEADYAVNKIILKGDKVKPDTERLFEILEKVKNDGYFIACGSGSINDLVKYLCHKFNNCYLVVGTAPSMDGYASSVSVLTVRGIKNTYGVTAPEAVVMDLDILTSAPWEMIMAGIGDLLGKVTSLLDWRMGHVLFGEYFCNEIFTLIESQLTSLINLADRLLERDYEAIKSLIKGLIYSGLAMELAGNSRPASGSEHHVAHFIDMCGLLNNQEVPLHGIQVGLGVYYTSRFYLRLKEMDLGAIEINHLKSERIKRIKKEYGCYSEKILENLEERWERELLTRELLVEKEAEIKGMIEDFLPFLEKIKDIIQKSGLLDMEKVRELYENSWLEKGLRYGFEYRPRYTVSTLLYQAGLLDQWVNDLFPVNE
jgi:glycerol-1-phosphate dehydrogenase [NAD(P)+]